MDLYCEKESGRREQGSESGQMVGSSPVRDLDGGESAVFRRKWDFLPVERMPIMDG